MIYLDIDGVLGNFNQQYLDFLEHPEHWSDLPKELSEHFHPENPDDFWENLLDWGEKFWVTMDPLPWADTFVQEFSGFGLGIRFLSAPAWSSPDSYSGKNKWISTVFPRHVHKLLLVPAEDKHRLAHSKRDVLLDDRPDTIERWDRAGGFGVHFDPHKAHDSEDYVFEVIDSIEKHYEDLGII
jgi:5'(3')-deoxyribonucleotidase